MDPNKDIAFHDPNRGKEVKKGETLICKYCNAIYEEKSWKHLKDLNPALIDKMQRAVCPACHYERNHLSDGKVTITGNFFTEHKEEILNTIHNTAEQAEERDVLNRIERMDESNPGELVIFTTQNKLAMEIGKKINDAFKGGDLNITFSKDDMPVDVKWHRD